MPEAVIVDVVRTPAAGYLSTPFADDIELSMRI